MRSNFSKHEMRQRKWFVDVQDAYNTLYSVISFCSPVKVCNAAWWVFLACVCLPFVLQTAEQECYVTQTNMKIDTEVAGLKTMLESHKLDTIKYVAGMYACSI